MVPLKPEFQRTQIGWRRGVTIDFFSPLGSLFREARGFDTKRGLINAKKITLKFVLFDLKHLFPPGDYVSLSGSQRQKNIVKHQLNSTQLNSTQLKSNFIGLDTVTTPNFSGISRPARELKFSTDTH